jgi:hypothetical protein
MACFGWGLSPVPAASPFARSRGLVTFSLMYKDTNRLWPTARTPARTENPPDLPDARTPENPEKRTRSGVPISAASPKITTVSALSLMPRIPFWSGRVSNLETTWTTINSPLVQRNPGSTSHLPVHRSPLMSPSAFDSRSRTPILGST